MSVTTPHTASSDTLSQWKANVSADLQNRKERFRSRIDGVIANTASLHSEMTSLSEHIRMKVDNIMPDGLKEMLAFAKTQQPMPKLEVAHTDKAAGFSSTPTVPSDSSLQVTG